MSVGVDYSGKPWNGESSQLILYFSHQGYVNGSEPTDLASHLDNIARLEAIVRYSSDDEKEGLVECQAPLLNGKVMFAE